MKLHVEKKPYVALCGANNSGKSLWLRLLLREFSGHSFMMPVSRFVFDLTLSPSNNRGFNEKNTNYDFSDGHNHDGVHFDPSHDLQKMSNADREDVLNICSDLIGDHFTVERIDSQNDLSEFAMKVNGQSFKSASTGTRLMVRLISDLKDKRFKRALIDEPELGLAPMLQARLAELLQDVKAREKHFPHLKTIVVSTHSHHFLNRKDFSSNFSVRRTGKLFSAHQIENVQGLQQLQYNLLGNTLENFFLPVAYIIVEGKTDKEYLERVIALRFPNRRVLIIGSEGDVKRTTRQLKTLTGGLVGTPYEASTFVVLDSVHSKGTTGDVRSLGVKEENIIVWKRNGIEYLYPPSILQGIFGVEEDAVGTIDISDSDMVRANGVEMRKAHLCTAVAMRLTPDTVYPAELEDRLLVPRQRSLPTE